MVVQFRNYSPGMSQRAVDGNPFENKTVVVVDDSRIQRRRLRELYESMGFRCVGEAENGLEGINLCEEKKPDLVSLDILMPVLHGVEAVGYIRDSGAAEYIILVSALDDLEEVAKLRPKGYTPDAIFSKKDSRETFREVLTNIFLADLLQAEEEAPTESPQEAEDSVRTEEAS